ncbi:family 1 glycosylhydrolase [Actinomadura rayongensis]|uniref:Family 1 glycosylhydrolase n=1 Tax=Actinomadura rayongensis TaxID=1429076 RepID=A0A6I4W3X0_9ACTN|nr:family 1 glycosylhydrolase [Actinomadura rayongensis]MXQ63125.1 family 1 glycosylhydrolase [Actinomadura rayongensis]
MRWPENFMWGTAASATQAEGAAPASDWWDWERQGRAPRSGDGNGFATAYADDFARYAGLGLRHHRMSVDWARLEPEPGRHDRSAVARYRDILGAAADAGLTPWLCLHHFTLPRWFAEPGGFTRDDHWREHWPRHVEFVAETFGDLVAGWQPVNEPNYYPWITYGGGPFPPARPDAELFGRASEGIHLATAEAARILRGTGKPVASIYGLSVPVALDDSQKTAERVKNHLADHWDAWIGLVRDGVLRVRDRPPIDAPHLAGVFDLIGFSYYRITGIRDGESVPYPPEAPLSDMGYAVSADGLRLVLEKLHAELNGTPLLVAEYGVGTDDDDLRAHYLRDGLALVNEAIVNGVDVRGFFHWTGVDNYEWLRGYDVSFGIIGRDRVIRPSAHVLKKEALG